MAQQIGVPTPTAVKTEFQPDRTSTPLLSDSKEGEDVTEAAEDRDAFQ